MAMTKPTSEQVTFLQTGTGATARTVDAKLKDTVSVKDFGAVGDGVTDDTAAIQAAMDYVGSVTTRLELFIPNGTYIISSPLLWNKPIRIRGNSAGRTGSTVLKANAIMSSVILASLNDVDTNLTQGSYFRDFVINGNSKANYGIKGKTNHSNFENLFITGTLVYAISIGYGWCCKYDNLDLSYNLGGGLELLADSNQIQVNHLKSFSNDGLGARISQGNAIAFYSCLFEQNKLGGILIDISNNTTIDCCYFEANSVTGYSYTSPSINIKADIICNGSTVATTLATSYPCYGLSITNCYVSTLYCETFIYSVAALGLIVSGNFNKGTVASLVKCYGNASGTYPSNGYISNSNLSNNVGFLNNNFIVNPIFSVLNYQAASNQLCDIALSNNIANLDFNTWTSSGAGGTIQRSSASFPTNENIVVWEIDGTGVTNTTISWFLITAANYPQYNGKTMIFSMWTYHPYTASDGGIVLYAAGVANIASYQTDGNAWIRKDVLFVMPASGTLGFGFRKISSAINGTVKVACPVLCEFGANVNDLSGNFGIQKNFYGAAAPTVGTWKVYDRVIKNNPAIGSPKAWICTVAGSPGTWVSEGNL